MFISQNHFWHMIGNGLNGEPFDVSYSANVFCRMRILATICKTITRKEKNFVVRFVPAAMMTNPLYRFQFRKKPALSSEALSQWTNDEIINAALLQNMEYMPGINSFMYFFGGAFTFFPYHDVDESLSFTPFLC